METRMYKYDEDQTVKNEYEYDPDEYDEITAQHWEQIELEYNEQN